MRVLVTGGTGFLGSHVARTLLGRGDQVRVLGRNLTHGEVLRGWGAEVLPGDLRARETVAAACEGMDAVVHAGAFSAPWGPAIDFYAVNVTGTQHVVDGCTAQGVRRLVYISSPSVVFNGRDQENVKESAPYPQRFASIYSRTKALGEEIVRFAGVQSKNHLETVVLRPKGIFGPGDTSLLPRLLNAARQGRLPQIGDGTNRVDLTFLDNVVYSVLLALESSAAVGNTYHITNGESPLLWDVIRHVLQELGCNCPLRQVPYPVAYAAAALMEAKSVVTRHEPLLTRYTVAVLGRTQTYDISAARRDLGYAPQISISEGIERAIAAVR